MPFIRLAIVVLLIAISNPILPSTLLIGDIQNSFSFPIYEKILVDNPKQCVYIASKNTITSGTGKNYAICKLEKSDKKFTPLITQQAIVNGTLMENPLYGSGFENFALIHSIEYITTKYIPAAVPINSQSVYFLIQTPAYRYNKNIIVSTDTLKAAGGSTGKIEGLQSFYDGACIAVCPADGDMGENGILYGYTIAEKTSGINQSIIKTAELQESFKKNFNKNITALKISNSEITYLHDFSMTGDQSLNAIYIAISGKGTSGIKTVTMLDSEIVNDDPCKANTIIATTTGDSPIYNKNIKTMHTSTGLAYLVIHQSENNNGTGENNVFAIPLVNDPNSSGFRRLANKNKNPEMKFSTTLPEEIYIGTYFSTPASQGGDLYTSGSIEAKVGGGPLKLNDKNYKITSIQTHRDTVFATAQPENLSDGISGTFYSQAILNSDWKIASWTPWQRKTVIGAYNAQSYIPYNGSYISISNGTNNMVLQSNWTLNGPCQTLYNAYFNDMPIKNGGVQGIFDIPYQHLKTNFGEGPSLAVFTGYQGIFIQQTSTSYGLFPHGLGQVFFTKDGSLSGIDETKDYSALVMTGGNLSNAGAIVASELAYSGADTWFVAGGTGGLFILIDSNGNGFGANGVGENFKYISGNMKWQQIGNFKNVKKIIAQNGYLYVITDKSLFRISSSVENFAKGKDIDYMVLATTSDFSTNSYCSFSDLAVSQKICLLATSVGLYRNGNATNISTSINSKDCSWTSINLPECTFPPICISTISTSGHKNDWSYDGSSSDISGNIYVIAGSIGTHRSYIYRFASKPTSSNNVVNDDTIKLIPNYFINGTESYYTQLPFEQMSIIGDGASWYTSGVHFASNFFKGILTLLNYSLRSGYPFAMKNIIGNFTSQTNSHLGPVTYVSGHGMWVAPSANGIYGLW